MYNRIRGSEVEKKYREYIKKVKQWKYTCTSETLKMQNMFPELIRVRGHYKCPLAGLRQHWWLVTGDNEIIDPTKKQFVAGGDYIPWKEESPEPTGKCMQCGMLVYNYQNFCDELCCAEYKNAITTVK